MSTSQSHFAIANESGTAQRLGNAVPWQLWVASALLAIEGILGNLPLILSQPVAAIWLAAKIVFITGFFLRWRPVYVIYLIVGSLHVLAFGTSAPFVAFLNLVLVVLVASTKGYFFGAR